MKALSVHTEPATDAGAIPDGCVRLHDDSEACRFDCYMSALKGTPTSVYREALAWAPEVP